MWFIPKTMDNQRLHSSNSMAITQSLRTAQISYRSAKAVKSTRFAGSCAWINAFTFGDSIAGGVQIAIRGSSDFAQLRYLAAAVSGRIGLIIERLLHSNPAIRESRGKISSDQW